MVKALTHLKFRNEHEFMDKAFD